ncbi:translation initiation factor IF-2 [Candidatus Wolfebacteria bacterium]|nr:translation initiation factor IF-2 [Candidatus Wolfebacteria bacterium]
MSKIENSKLKIENLTPRSPIVVIMGHVDHGKTTLLDYIRKTNIVAKEAGGITQSIGAYEIKHNEKKITFIDTPGHEAFSKMRARGANVADLAILVVAADDGIKPQTKESIEILNSSKTPFIVAINKIDKPGADIEKAKNDLMANNVFLEGYGSNISWQAISAKNGQGVNELLDLILLAAEMENLTYEPKANASGVIIEAKADSRRGIVVSAIVKNGILKTGSRIATKSACGKIKILEDFLGKKTDELSPSGPAMILGFETLPQIGEEFIAGNIDLAEIQIPQIEKIKSQPIIEAENFRKLNLILKSDVSGSLEILSEIAKNISFEDIKTRIISESIGEITDGDVKNADSSKSIIIAFKTKQNKIAESAAKISNIKIISSEIIYELVEAIKDEIKLLAKPVPQGIFETIKIFSSKSLPAGRQGEEQLIGGRVVSGVFKNNQRLKILRAEKEIGNGKITNIKKHKQDANQVSSGEECGFMFESEIKINEGDKLIWM